MDMPGTGELTDRGPGLLLGRTGREKREQHLTPTGLAAAECSVRTAPLPGWCLGIMGHSFANELGPTVLGSWVPASTPCLYTGIQHFLQVPNVKTVGRSPVLFAYHQLYVMPSSFLHGRLFMLCGHGQFDGSCRPRG